MKRRHQTPTPTTTTTPPAPVTLPPATKLAIVCAYRNEPDLDATVRSALASSAGCATTCYRVEDTRGVGPGRARHGGITRAIETDKPDAVIIIDAHMRFSAGLLSGMADAVRRDPGLLLAAPCHHNEQCDFSATPYRGARFAVRADNGPEKVALCAQWAGPGDQPNAIMGACYAFSPDLYLGSGQPLRALHSWGCDEEYLSACAWFAGGRVAIYDGGAAAHRYRSVGVAQPGVALQAGIWANRLQLLDILPLPEHVRSDLLAWTRQSVVFSDGIMGVEIARRMDAGAVVCATIRETLATHRRDAGEWLAQCRPFTTCNRQSNIMAAEPAAPPQISAIVLPPATPVQREEPQIVLRRVEQCERCGTLNPFRQSAGLRRVADRLDAGYAKCFRCGHKAKLLREYPA